MEAARHEALATRSGSRERGEGPRPRSGSEPRGGGGGGGGWGLVRKSLSVRKRPRPLNLAAGAGSEPAGSEPARSGSAGARAGGHLVAFGVTLRERSVDDVDEGARRAFEAATARALGLPDGDSVAVGEVRAGSAVLETLVLVADLAAAVDVAIKVPREPLSRRGAPENR